MSLPYETATLDDLPDSAREHYVPNESGGFILSIDGAPGLTSALKKERTAVGELKKQIRELSVAPPDRGAEFETLSSEKTALETELAAARAAERDIIGRTILAVTLESAGALPESVDVLAEHLGKRIKFETVDGKRKIQIMQADGKTPMGRPGGQPARFMDLAKEARSAFPSQFVGTGAGGGGAPPKSPRPGSKTITRADFEKLGSNDRHTKISAGYSLID